MKALGDYCGGVPPLSIPNREVKTASADGTAQQCGRVGRRHSFETPFLYWDGVFFAIKVLCHSIDFKTLRRNGASEFRTRPREGYEKTVSLTLPAILITSY